MTRKLSGFFYPNLSKRNSVLFISVFISVIVFDSTIIKFSTYSGIELPLSSNIVIFLTLSTIYAVGGIMLLNSVRKNISNNLYKLPLNLKYLHGTMFAVQLAMIGIIVTIVSQIIISHRYSMYLLHGSTFLTHISALLFLTLLVIIFGSWLKSRRNYVTILYMASFILISANVMVSLTYLESYFSSTVLDYVRPHAIHFAFAKLTSSQWTESLSSVFDILSLSSFLAAWLATIILLYQYRFKVGTIKYYTLTAIPLIYYLVPFQDYFGNVFSPLVLNSPIFFGVAYVLIFSATKQIGALLFSLAFWTASSLVTNKRVRYSLLASAIGIALLFSSVEITTLVYKIYPPYGLVTEAFIPLGAYLLFVGIFTSATNVARDAKLRKEFYKSAMSQFNLLKTIGVTQMEKELLKEYKPVLARSNELSESQYQPLEQSDVKQIIHDVLQELQARQSQAPGNSTK